ncbi:MAG: hypothetical protein JWQ32_2388 [Marmoricola sp.]|nr:hypothetical protein [Marmoricola sp.]
MQLRRVVALSDHRAESQRETWVRLALLDAGLPEPELQAWVDVEGTPTYRLDLAYRAQRIAIEYDGSDFHDSPAQRRHDSERRQWLRDHGWTVIVVRNGDFTGGQLLSWTSAVREALADTYSTRRW